VTDFREDGAAALEWTARYLFVTHTKVGGRYVLRLAIGNARTTEDDVRRAWNVFNREAEQ